MSSSLISEFLRPGGVELVEMVNRSSQKSLDRGSDPTPSNDRDIDFTVQGDIDSTKIQQNGHTQEYSMGNEGQERTILDDEESVSVRSEHTFIATRDLGVVDVAALIINKQIGNGIFTTPGLVLSLTGSKTISTVMWFCGGIWAFAGVVIYVEFGSAFPFNGGELIYLDEVIRVPELLATVLFSAFFITGSNTDGNSLQFAKNVLLAANPEVTNTTELDKRLITLIAIIVLTGISFVHYFSRNSGLFLNLSFAAYKILLVLVLIIAGGRASSQASNGLSDWGDQPIPKKNILAALIYIMYSYQGWENANYVGGELKVERHVLKLGALLAVSVTTILYVLVTVAYSLACTFPELVGEDLSVVTKFAPKVFGDSGATGIKICVALSTFGNLIAVIYTTAKVKQQIARQCILPFYKFFAREDKQFNTPSGGLILHWLMAVIWIIATPNTSGGYGFVVGVFVYGQLIVGVCLGFAFFFLRSTYEAENTRKDLSNGSSELWQPVMLKNRILQVVVPLILIGMNLMVLIQSARSAGEPPSWVRPIIILGVLALGAVYWLGIWSIEKRSDENSPLEIRIVRDGRPIRESDKVLLQMAKTEGNARVVVYEPHGWLKGALNSIEVVLWQLVRLIAR